MKKVQIQVEGMHCQGCQARIESAVKALEGVKAVRVDYTTGKGAVEFDERKVARKKVFKTIGELGYRVREANGQTEASRSAGLSQRLIIAAALAALFVAVSFLLNRLGALQLLARLNERNLGYGLIFGIGLLSSFHCVGMCGGLVVTYTASAQRQALHGETGHSTTAHLLYNVGRVISYAGTGAILGGFGSFFAISPVFTGVVTLLAAAFMILMGLSLLTEFGWLQKLRLPMPSLVARYVYGQAHSSRPKGPFIIGLLNGLMPCGPLQAMQLYALGSGSVLRGALSMGVYALGTVPMMFGLGSVLSMLSQERTKQALRLAGVVVLVLGVLMFSRGLANFGRPSAVTAKQVPAVAQPTVPAPTAEPTVQAPIAESTDQPYQVVNMTLTRRGYEPNVLYAKVGVPVRWIIDVKEMSGCTNRLIMPEYGINKTFKYGENVIEFTPRKVGEIPFSCWMRMVWGKFVIQA